MELGMIGLGKIGSNLAIHAAEKKIQVVGYAKEVKNLDELGRRGVVVVPSLAELARSLRSPRVIFLYVPAGRPVDEVLDRLVPLLQAGDGVVDGGNSYFRDSIARQKRLEKAGIGFVDCGTSGGLEGARSGACFMVGGMEEAVAPVAPILRKLAAVDGFFYAGPPGAGHFVKLVHNAIEFGMLQSIGEGVELLRHSDYRVDLIDLFHAWSHGSVIRGWLMELMELGLREHPDLSKIPSYVEDTGEVNWILEEAIEYEVPMPAIAQSVFALFESRGGGSDASRTVALLRNQFGGHSFGPQPSIAKLRKTGRVGRWKEEEAA
ncbi:MAG: decarboxylating 6-phosphogluconate dehydrogenase [Candidatus Manganitrophaceae bacterium]|nr:MAG: decarboxylating 6-phosphogluconate dehydrogenase [Candidatus Manganitrophaceae bacterium]